MSDLIEPRFQTITDFCQLANPLKRDSSGVSPLKKMLNSFNRDIQKKQMHNIFFQSVFTF